MKKKPKTGAPKTQTMAMTPKSGSGKKNSRPTVKKLDTPRVAVAPEPLTRKKSPKY